MSKHINWNEVSKKISLPSGGAVVLIERLGMQKKIGKLECAKNIFLLDKHGDIVWQVSSDFDSDGGAFTNVMEDGGELKAYRWDGGIYKIDSITGFAKPLSLMK